MMKIRAEQPKDIEAIHKVIIAAFERTDEADLVDRLRGVTSTLSFVAVERETVELETIVGHIFFSPVTIDRKCADGLADDSDDRLPMLGLAPLAVLPAYQRQGIGSLLIQHGLKECDRLGFKAVVVLGSSKYYPRFGFIPAKEKGLSCEYPVPDEAFMVLELKKGALEGRVGIVRYHAEFDGIE
jgi:putative acetyltransferase